MPSQEFELDPPMPGDAPWFPADKPLTTVVDGTGDIRPMTGVVQPPVAPPVGVLLDPSIAFERALGEMALTARSKRGDYALSDDEFSNFRAPADLAGIPAWLMGLLEVQWKLERIKSLRANGKMDNPQNESVEDTIKDAAVFGALAYAMWLEEKAAASG